MESGRMPFLFAFSLVLALSLLPSCAPFLRDFDSEERAKAHMRMADSLEQASAVREAAFEYGLVVQHYPRTEAYPEALRKAALLSLQCSESAQTDSLGRAMLELYLEEGPATQKEQESIETLIALAARLEVLRKETRRQGQALDSLSVAFHRQTNSVCGQMQRVTDLEQQLRQVMEELRRLKQVDLDITRNRRQKSKG